MNRGTVSIHIIYIVFHTVLSILTHECNTQDFAVQRNMKQTFYSRDLYQEKLVPDESNFFYFNRNANN